MERKVAAGLQAGCMRFDAALGGVGGCPMASDQLVSNPHMEQLVQWLEQKGYSTGIDMKKLMDASLQAQKLFA